jgi:ribonucleoside-diphosphate reductase alpha chain
LFLKIDFRDLKINRKEMALMTPLGYKIFLTRYALKVPQDNLNIGDKVIVCNLPQSTKREIGTVTLVEKGKISVVLDETQTSINVPRTSRIEKLIELNYDDAIERVSKAVSSLEKEEKQNEFYYKFKWLMGDFRFIPGGRILTAAGTNSDLTFYNCYVIPSPKDSRGGILDTLSTMTEIMARGGGVGINISSLRPARTVVRGVNGLSSGAVSWGELYSFTTGLIEQGGSRRGALMLMMYDWHPDVLEFINIKRDMKRVTNANISVAISDKFMDAVKNDGNWVLEFPDTSVKNYDNLWDGNLAKWKSNGYLTIEYATMKASEIWDNIVKSAWACAEPGVWFYERANKYSNSWYYNNLITTNPCGEVPLPEWGVCNLGSINLGKFVKNQELDSDSLQKAVKYAVRFLDNVIDLTPYFFDKNREVQLAERRVGLGTMGLAELLIRLKIRYGSDECINFLHKLYKLIAITAYTESCSIALDKGSFPLFNQEKYLQSEYMKTLLEGEDTLRKSIQENGMRNVTLLTQAPTGATGTMANTSNGIEPFYDWTFDRSGMLGVHEERVKVYDEWLTTHPNEELPSYFVTAMGLKTEEHVTVQATIQKWVDASISKTCNVPHEYTVEQTKKLYDLIYNLGSKGSTIYRNRCRDQQVLTSKSEPESKEVSIQYLSRPPVLDGKTTRKNTPIGTAYITVNSHNKSPFEVFVNVSKVGSDVAADAEGFGRLISLILRMPSALSPKDRVSEIIAQLRGIGSGHPRGFGKNRVMSLPDAIAQVLADEINVNSTGDIPGLPDNGENGGIEKDVCPECGNVLMIRTEGCMKCLGCGFSLC